MVKDFMKQINSLQKMGKMKDSITTGLLGGFLGAIFMDISNLLIFKAGKTETLYGYIAGGLFVAPFRTKRRKNFILGEVAHLAIGSIWGIPLTYILKKTGKDHYLIKGMLVAALSLGTLIAGQKFGWLKKFRLTKTFYSAIWNHIVYGLVSAQSIVLLADPTLFALSNEKQKRPNSQIKPEVSYSYSMVSTDELDKSEPHYVEH